MWTLMIIFVLMNVVAIFHAYKFTHFSNDLSLKTDTPKSLTLGQKIKTILFGVNNPRPENKTVPKKDFEVVKLKSNKEIECWSIIVQKPKGTVILFHGFSSEKSSLLEQSDLFNDLGYSTLLVDFMGSGGSEGNQTTIGFMESEQVKTSFEYIIEKNVENVYLYGSSMGSVAIMKSINDHKIKPKGVILECPFGTMSQTVSARFRNMGVPSFPMASLLVFWGGVQNSFWAFGHNPTEYAKKIKCPTLLLYGAKDDKVTRSEIDEIFNNLRGEKRLNIYKNAGHESYLEKYKYEWNRDVGLFMKKHP
ncbi:MAG: alpha/beta hydrolase [Crocinitomicaceae bacterium]|nr:alpha/beta hydrolase [Crocinitomicaceae bacterium]